MTGILVALGGNAISPPGEEGNVAQQFAHTKDSLRLVVRGLAGTYDRVLITHGNGPQIGNILLRSELAAPGVYPLPLDTCVSNSQGGMGYMIQQVLHNVLREEHDCVRTVVSLLTQTVVDADDPAWDNPTKFIGRGHGLDEARVMMAERAWRMKEDGKRGWRRVVPSPLPMEIVEEAAIRTLLEQGTWVIAAGGGGIPVLKDGQGRLHGAEAVVDKDLASALLANSLGIEILVFLTGVEKVSLDYGTAEERPLDRMTVDEAEEFAAQGQFPAGSMGPKVDAAIRFLRRGGKRVVITSAEAGWEVGSGTELIP